jgi:hypothetical protein
VVRAWIRHDADAWVYIPEKYRVLYEIRCGRKAKRKRVDVEVWGGRWWVY